MDNDRIGTKGKKKNATMAKIRPKAKSFRTVEVNVVVEVIVYYVHISYLFC